MALKPFSLVSLIPLLLLLFSPPLSDAAAPKLHDKKFSPFGFLKHVEGSQKGDEIKGINDLKKYLDHFGYLSYSHSINPTDAKEDEFDDALESAIKTYQLNYHLNATGILDAETVSTMMMSRCGMADIINGTNWMPRSGNGSLHTTPLYAFFSESTKWPPAKYHLTYGFDAGSPAEIMNPVAQAFQTWASNSQFTFSRAEQDSEADLKIGFHSGDHGDGNTFDGPGGVLAHAFAPTDGRLHYDGDEAWSVGAVPGRVDLQTVALHEIGHLLGLQHSEVPEAVMYPAVATGVTKGLHADDIAGIKALYSA